MVNNEEKVILQEIMTVANVRELCRDMIEVAYDMNFQFMGYSGIGNDKFFKTENEALDYVFNSDELYQYIKDLDLKDKVIERYVGLSEYDCSLVPYIPFS